MQSWVTPSILRSSAELISCAAAPTRQTVGSELLREKDTEKAKALLAEAGYDGTPVVILDPTDVPVAHGQALVTAQALRDIGMNVELSALDWATMTSRRAVRGVIAERWLEHLPNMVVGGRSTEPDHQHLGRRIGRERMVRLA